MREELPADFLFWGESLRQGLHATRLAVAQEGADFLGLLYQAHVAVVAVAASVLSRPDRSYDPSEVKLKLHRAGIHTSVIQGINPIEYCIEHGCYVQAAALVRQEMEAAEVLRGIRAGHHRKRENPRLKALLHQKKLYEAFTGLAHVTDLKAMIDVFQNEVGNVDHRFNKDFAQKLFSIHLLSLSLVVLDMAELRPHSDETMLSLDEDDWLSSAFGIMEQAGLLSQIFVNDAEPPAIPA